MMIASMIGKTFLNEFNKRESKKYTAQQFFTEVFHPLFYGYPKYLQWIINSPYVQGLRENSYPDKKEIEEKLNTFIEKAKTSKPDASIAIGYPSIDTLATTSGQVTNLNISVDEEDIYASWIGGGFGIGVNGGLSIYFDNPDVLWMIYKGWPYYREWIEITPEMKGRQIDTWNGQWVSYFKSSNYIKENPLIGLQDCRENKKGIIRIKTQHWTKVLFNLSRLFPNINIIGYIFSLGQMNKTIGFVPFQFPEINRIFDLYIKLFGEMNFKNGLDKIEEAFTDVNSLLISCEKGSIGIHSLEPRGLRQFMPGRDRFKIPKYKNQPIENIIKLNAYKIWVIAMLNNEELLQKAQKVSEIFLQFESLAKKGKTDHLNIVKEILSSYKKRKFIESLIPIVELFGDSASKLQNLVIEVNKMPATQFPYFLTLIKFEYAIAKSK